MKIGFKVLATEYTRAPNENCEPPTHPATRGVSWRGVGRWRACFACRLAR